jgi:hypothetical protein
LVAFGSSNNLGDVAVERINAEGFGSVRVGLWCDTVFERFARLCKRRYYSVGSTQKGECD